MKCKYCGKEMKVGFSRKVYCSKECYDNFYGAKHQKLAGCAVCGKPLEGKRRTYCSDECSEKAQLLLRYERQRSVFEVIEPPKRKRGRPKKKLTISEVNELARAEGLNYGQYVAKYGL